MPEIVTPPEGKPEGEAAPAAGDQNLDKKDEGGEGDAPAGKEGEGDGKPDPKKPEGSQGDENEPPVQTRKTAKDFIIERKERKIAKLEAAKAGEGDGGKGGEKPDDGEIDPEDEEIISKVVSKQITPLIEKQIEAEDEAEVQQFVAENPDFKPYEAKVKAFMKHPSRREIPIKSLFYEAAGDDLLKIGAERAKKAAEEAARSGTGGGSARSEEGEGKPDWVNMPKDEFEKRKLEMLYPKRQ